MKKSNHRKKAQKKSTIKKKKASVKKIKPVAQSVKKPAGPVYDCIIFDIDNVLIDTRTSYLDAIRWTVEIFLTHSKVPIFMHRSKTSTPFLLTKEDVECFKLLGGFNDDWDCCYGILTYLLSLPVKDRNLSSLKEAMRIKEFLAKNRTKPLGVSGIVKKLGRPSIVTIEKISRIFQEIYLGKDIFSIKYKMTPQFWKKRGLMRKEKLIFKKRFLEKLKRLGLKLGIATGRSRFEAAYALKNLGVLHLFDAATTMNEVKKAEKELCMSLRKPHPFSILQTAKHLKKGRRLLYIGDLPDDVIAANQAKEHLAISSVAMIGAAHDTDHTLNEIKKTHPDYIIHKPAELWDIVLKG
ncbi:MAG: HAD hydrolase-like protein [Candidatus Omnitrophica bacterium]|nr:HAD hydrolase-like protein [Candidatus Omnitrophota bacterium]